MDNISKKNVLYSNENSTDKNKIKNDKSSIKKYIKKKNDQLFMNKIERIMNKKGQLTTQNKSKVKEANYSVNNSYANFKKQFGTNLYNHYNIHDKTFSNDLSRLKESNTNDNTVILNNKSSNKNLKIECSYYCSNKNNYNISGDKYIKKKKHYISSVPCSTRKNIQKNMNSNTNTSIKKEKDLIGGG